MKQTGLLLLLGSSLSLLLLYPAVSSVLLSPSPSSLSLPLSPSSLSLSSSPLFCCQQLCAVVNRRLAPVQAEEGNTISLCSSSVCYLSTAERQRRKEIYISLCSSSVSWFSCPGSPVLVLLFWFSSPGSRLANGPQATRGTEANRSSESGSSSHRPS